MTFRLNLFSHAYTALQPHLGTDLICQAAPLLIRKMPSSRSSLMFINAPVLRILQELLIAAINFPGSSLCTNTKLFLLSFGGSAALQRASKGGTVSPPVEKQTLLCSIAEHKHYLEIFFSSPNHLNSVLLMVISSFVQHEISYHDSELPESSGIKTNHWPAGKCDRIWSFCKIQFAAVRCDSASVNARALGWLTTEKLIKMGS